MKHLSTFLAIFLAFASMEAQSHAAPSQATAQKVAAAEALFEQGKKLFDEGKYEQARVKFEQSDRLDHGAGTQFRIAECYERLGQIASAWSHFVMVADELKRAGDPREAQARARADALKPRIPTLTVIVSVDPAKTPGFQVKRDATLLARALWDQALPVDPGDHVIEASAPGMKPWRRKIIVRERETAQVNVPELDPLPTQEGGMPVQRIVALPVVAVGLAGVVVGSIYGLKAFDQWGKVQDLCKQDIACSQDDLNYGGSASTSATVSTIGFIAGGVGLAAASALWLTAPTPSARPERAAWQLAPTVGPGIVAGTLRATF